MFDYAHDNADRRTSVTRGDGTRIDYGYDPTGQLTSAVRKFASGEEDHSYRYQYGYDPSGNPTNRVENGQAHTFTANNLNQLDSATGPTHTDVSGPYEGTAASATVNGQPATLQPSPKAFYKDGLPLAAGTNQFEAILADTLGRTATNRSTVVKEAAPVFSYDDNGNLLSDGTWNYTWDNENRLLEASPVNPKVGDKKVQNYYDTLSRRSAKLVYTRTVENTWAAEKEIRFTWLDWLMIREDIQTDELTDAKSYTWGVDLSGTLQGAGAVGSLLLADGQHNQATFALHPAYDGNGNVVAHLNVGGVVEEFSYNPFGRLTKAASSETSPTTFLYSTKYLDAETESYYFGFRHYNASYGLWLNRDPIEEADDVNLSRYVKNNPVDSLDKLGLLTARIHEVLYDDTQGCSGWFYARRFELPDRSARQNKKGYIVQKVERYQISADCSASIPLLPAKPTEVFFEAWEVSFNNGKVNMIRPETSYIEDESIGDSFIHHDKNNFYPTIDEKCMGKKGRYKVHTVARLFMEDKAPDVANWKKSNGSKLPTLKTDDWTPWDAAFEKDEPEFSWENEIIFNCCKGN